MTMLRWGVLGAANIAHKAVIPAIHASNNGKLVAIAARDRDRAEKLAQATNIPEVLDDYAALINNPNIDAVYIPLPNSEHHRWTIAAAEAGKHILCEKPLALNAQQAEEMAQAAERAGVKLAEAFMYRHHPIIKDLLDVIQGGAIGELRIVRSSFSFNLSNDENIRLSTALGGGALMDVGCYGVSLARLFTGAEPSAVAGVAVKGPSGVDESFIGVMRFNSGVVAEIDVSMRAAGDSRYELIGSTGRIFVRHGFKLAPDEEGEIQITQGGEVSRIFTEADNQYKLMIEEFGRAVLDDRPLRFPAADAVGNMRVIDALLNAAV